MVLDRSPLKALKCIKLFSSDKGPFHILFPFGDGVLSHKLMKMILYHLFPQVDIKQGDNMISDPEQDPREFESLSYFIKGKGDADLLNILPSALLVNISTIHPLEGDIRESHPLLESSLSPDPLPLQIL